MYPYNLYQLGQIRHRMPEMVTVAPTICSFVFFVVHLAPFPFSRVMQPTYKVPEWGDCNCVPSWAEETWAQTAAEHRQYYRYRRPLHLACSCSTNRRAS